jgi:transposase
MSSSTDCPVAFVGIDWADAQHDIYLRPADGSAPSHEIIGGKTEELQEWILRMRERCAGTGGQIFVCLEQSKGALIYQLREYDFFVLYPVNPKTLASFREAFRPSGAKGDKSDADLLCELVQQHRDRLHAWHPEAAETRALAAFCEKRRKAVQAAVRLVQQLRSELKTYYPCALDLVELHSLLACDFLRRWPTQAALQRARAQTIRQFFYAHNCRRVEELNATLARLPQAVAVTTDPAIIEPAALQVQLLAAQLRAILTALPEFDREIAQRFAAHPEAELFGSFPGAGPQLAPRLLTAFGTQRERLQSAEQMSVMSGVAPVRKASGKSCVIQKRWACAKFLRQTFHEFANCSLARCAWAKAFYEEQRRRNKRHHTAVRALAFKWMRILFACWQHRTPYDDAFYNQALQKHGSTFACA